MNPPPPSQVMTFRLHSAQHQHCSRCGCPQTRCRCCRACFLAGGRQDGVVRQDVRGAPRRHRKSHLQDGKVRLGWVLGSCCRSCCRSCFPSGVCMTTPIQSGCSSSAFFCVAVSSEELSQLTLCLSLPRVFATTFSNFLYPPLFSSSFFLPLPRPPLCPFLSPRGNQITKQQKLGTRPSKPGTPPSSTAK